MQAGSARAEAALAPGQRGGDGKRAREDAHHHLEVLLELLPEPAGGVDELLPEPEPVEPELLDGEVLSELLLPEVPLPMEDEPLAPVLPVDEPEPLAPIEPVLPGVLELPVVVLDRLADEPVVEVSLPPLPQAVRDSAAAATRASVVAEILVVFIWNSLVSRGGRKVSEKNGSPRCLWPTLGSRQRRAVVWDCRSL